jgi:hypothetical protein
MTSAIYDSTGISGGGLLPTPPVRYSITGGYGGFSWSQPTDGIKQQQPVIRLAPPPPPPPDESSDHILSKLRSSIVPGVCSINTCTIELPDRRVFIDEKIHIKNSIVSAEYKNSFIDFHECPDMDKGSKTRSVSCPPIACETINTDVLSNPWGGEFLIPTQLAHQHTGPITTYMIRNIPTRFTSITFVRLLEDYGFGKTFDFFYLPMDFRSGKNMGYAFINFKSPEIGEKFNRQFNGKRLPVSTSKKVVDISPSRRQGLMENVSLFRTSDLLNSVSLPHYKPLVAVDDGTLVPLSDINFVMPT